MVRADNAATSPADLAGMRIGAIAGSTNMRLAETFDGIERVSFPGTADVFGDMIRRRAIGTIDGFVDDDVVWCRSTRIPTCASRSLLATRNRWGVAVRRGDDGMRALIDSGLGAAMVDGALATVWARSMPWLPFPLASGSGALS